MAGLPQVQKVKMEALKAAGDAPAVHIKPPGATAVVSMVPDGERPRPPGSAVPKPAEIDPNDFAVDPVPKEPAPVALAPEPVHTPSPRAGDEDLPRPKEGTAEHAYWLRWKSVSGMYERVKADNAKLQESLDSLGVRFDAIASKLDELKAVQAPPVTAPRMTALDADLSDTERETYKDALPVIEKMAGRIVAKALEDAGISGIKTEVGEIKNSTTALSKTQAETDERAFIDRVRDKFPKMDSMVREDDWNAYMAERVPFSSHTFGEALWAAHKQRNFDRVSEIMSGYKSAPKPTIDELSTPSRSAENIDPVATASRNKPILKWSERQKAGLEFRKGRITRERLDAINAMYTEAEKEGRINMNA